MTPDELAAELLERVGHVHISTTSEGWHCFTFTRNGPDTDDIEMLCGDGSTIAEALEAVLAQASPDRIPREPASE